MIIKTPVNSPAPLKTYTQIATKFLTLMSLLIDRLQKLRYKKIMFDELYFSEKPALETFLTTITLLRWTQVKELYFNYPINLLINKQINALMHAIQKSAVRVLSLDNAKGGWNIADINAFTMGLIGSEITTLDLKN